MELPTREAFLASIKRIDRGEAGDECSICTLEWNDDHIPVRIPQCGHIFGEHCLITWSGQDSANCNTCPMCRAVLFQDSNLAQRNSLNLQGYVRCILHDMRSVTPSGSSQYVDQVAESVERVAERNVISTFTYYSNYLVRNDTGHAEGRSPELTAEVIEHIVNVAENSILELAASICNILLNNPDFSDTTIRYEDAEAKVEAMLEDIWNSVAGFYGLNMEAHSEELQRGHSSMA